MSKKHYRRKRLLESQEARHKKFLMELTRVPAKRRSGTKTDNVCPICSQRFSSVVVFCEHIKSHVPDHGDKISSVKFRIEAILLGLASAALWDFFKWSIENTPIPGFFHSLFPTWRMGPAPTPQELLCGPLKDIEQRPKFELTMEQGLYRITEGDPETIGLLDLCLRLWIFEGSAKESVRSSEGQLGPRVDY